MHSRNLLKDEYDLSALEPPPADAPTPPAPVPAEPEAPRQFVCLEEVQRYLDVRAAAAKSYVLALLLFFCSPFAGMLLTVWDERLGVIGSVVQVILLTVMAVILLLTRFRLAAFRHLRDPAHELAYGVRGVIEKKRADFRHTHLTGILLGVICMMGSVLPMMICSAFTDDNDTAIVLCGCLMLLIFAAGLSAIVYICCIDGGYRKILKMK